MFKKGDGGILGLSDGASVRPEATTAEANNIYIAASLYPSRSTVITYFSPDTAQSTSPTQLKIARWRRRAVCATIY